MATTAHWYDLNSRLTSQTDPSGYTIQYAYNALDWPTSVTYSGAQETYGQFDSVGNPKQITDPNGTVWTVAYDALSRVTSRTCTPGSDTVGTTQSFAYDGLSRLTSSVETPQGGTAVTRGYAYNLMGATPTVTESQSLGALGTVPAVTRTYTHGGRQTALQYPHSRTLAYSQDTQGRLNQILESGTPLVTYGYVGDRVARRDVAGAVRTDLAYNPTAAADRITGFTYAKLENGTPTTTLEQWSFT